MRVRIFAIFALIALVAVAAPLSPSFARQADDDSGRLPLKLEAPQTDAELPADMPGLIADQNGTVRVLIELQGTPSARVYADGVERGDKAKAAGDAKAALATIDRAQQALQRTLQSTAIGAQVLGRTQRVFNGVSVKVERAKLGAIAGLAGVKAIKPVRELTLDNAGGVPLVQAPTVWSSAAAGNALGESISIGVIDTGIDYLHTDFGGPGTPESYAANNTAQLGDAPFPSAKVTGGYDFVGDAYNAGGSGDIAVPKPDPDPLDCNGHGTHVAGSAAGYGVNADGSVYAGPWNNTLNFDAFRIGPGVAPRAELVALRVFGCAGSSSNDVVVQAIEYAADPNGDGDFADHLDVINMSLGSNFGDPYEADIIAVNNVSDVGVIAAVAAGNDADTFYIMGGPGGADKAITVAGVVDDLNILDGFRVNTPGSIAGVKPGLNSVAYVWNPPAPAPPKPDVTGDLVYPPTQRSGCQVFSAANQLLLAGKIALLDWTETAPDVSECGSGVRVGNAQAAGAIGVVYDYGKPDFTGGFTGSALIPAIFTPAAVGAELKANLAGGINVTLTDDYNASVKSRNTGQIDSVYVSTSRGPASGTTALKPDIAGPAVTIFSADSGTGTQGVISSGTSMATPHVAGAMALLRQIHPTWTVQELKALAMNTASAPVRQTADPASLRMAPQRVGSNRLTMADAIAASVVAYSADDAGRVNVSFGAVEVVGTKSAVKTVEVVNKGTAAASYSLSYQPVTDVAGVSFSVSPAQLSVPAGGKASFTVTMQADAASLPHAYDPTITMLQNGQPRHWLTEEAGHAILTPSAGTTLRVPVYAAARAASDMHAAFNTIDLGSAATASATIDLVGVPVGSGQALLTPSPTDEVSLVTAFELQHSSPNEATSGIENNRSDLQYVGVFSDYPATRSIADPDGSGPRSGTTLAFGIATHGDWTSPQGAYDQRFEILIDTNRDGSDDYLLQNWDYGTLTNQPAQTDVFIAVLDDLKNASVPLKIQFVNGLPASTLNTVPYNTSVLMLPVAAADLGLTNVAAAFDYTVHAFSINAEDEVDITPKLTYNAAKPGLDLTAGQAGLPAYLDLPGSDLQFGFTRADFEAAKSQGVLLLHHLNGAGKRADAVQFGKHRRMLPGISVR